MALANLGFETAGDAAGLASGWTFTDDDSVNEWAPYNDPPVAFEAFEQDWDSNEDYLFAFDDPNTQLSSAEYTTIHVDTKFVEDFEEKWDSNEFYVFGIGSATPASYGGQDFEDFEQDWDSNEDYIFAFVGVGDDLDEASFDGNAFENFEQSWDSNEDYTTDRIPEFVALGIIGSSFATPIEVEVYPAHQMHTGNRVVVAGHAGNTNANGEWLVTVTSDFQFTLDGSVGNAPGFSTGTATEFNTESFEADWLTMVMTTV